MEFLTCHHPTSGELNPANGWRWPRDWSGNSDHDPLGYPLAFAVPRPAGPPALTSDQYNADFNEVKSMGGSTNSGRTADQTLFANVWQTGNPADYWDQVVISLAEQDHLSMSQTAPLLALVNVDIADVEGWGHRLLGREIHL